MTAHQKHCITIKTINNFKNSTGRHLIFTDKKKNIKNNKKTNQKQKNIIIKKFFYR